MTACSAIVLAGGHSARMGQDKALLELEGTAILRRTVDTLRQLTEDILIVGRPPDPTLPASAVSDSILDLGPMGGLSTGLPAMRHRYIVCVGCDHPWLDANVLDLLLSRVDTHDAVVPIVYGRAQVLHAVYDRSILPIVRSHLDSRRLSMRSLLKDLRVCWVDEADIRPLDPELRSFINVNTPEDWDTIRTLPREDDG